MKNFGNYSTESALKQALNTTDVPHLVEALIALNILQKQSSQVEQAEVVQTITRVNEKSVQQMTVYFEIPCNLTIAVRFKRHENSWDSIKKALPKEDQTKDFKVLMNCQSYDDNRWKLEVEDDLYHFQKITPYFSASKPRDSIDQDLIHIIIWMRS